MKNEKKDSPFIPFGEEWKAEMMKMTKSDLIDKFVKTHFVEKANDTASADMARTKVGMDRVSTDLKNKFVKLGRKRGISSINVIGTENGSFSGGMIGSPEVILEALFHLGKREAPIKMVLEMVACALNEVPVEKAFPDADRLAEVPAQNVDLSIKALVERGELSLRVLNTLSNVGIFELGQLAKMQHSAFKDIKRMGKIAIEAIEGTMKKYGLTFLQVEVV